MIIDKMKFGKFCAEARLRSGMTQAQVAKKLGYSGPQYVANWEQGICVPPLDRLHQLTKILEIDPNEVVDLILSETERFLRKELRMKSR